MIMLSMNGIISHIICDQMNLNNSLPLSPPHPIPQQQPDADAPAVANMKITSKILLDS